MLADTGACVRTTACGSEHGQLSQQSRCRLALLLARLPAVRIDRRMFAASPRSAAGRARFLPANGNLPFSSFQNLKLPSAWRGESEKKRREDPHTLPQRSVTKPSKANSRAVLNTIEFPESQFQKPKPAFL